VIEVVDRVKSLLHSCAAACAAIDVVVLTTDHHHTRLGAGRSA